MPRSASPPRWIMPTTGGCSVASGPRARWPLSRLRRPHRPCVPRLPAFPGGQPRWSPRPRPPRLPREGGRLGDQPVAPRTGHGRHVRLLELAGVGHGGGCAGAPHPGAAQPPDATGRMMARHAGVGPIVAASAPALAQIARTRRRGRLMPVWGHLRGRTRGTTAAGWPASSPHGLNALGRVETRWQVYHGASIAQGALWHTCSRHRPPASDVGTLSPPWNPY
jgi:hypothetical protein